jgi:hypothetical protein
VILKKKIQGENLGADFDNPIFVDKYEQILIFYKILQNFATIGRPFMGFIFWAEMVATLNILGGELFTQILLKGVNEKLYKRLNF